MNTPYDHIFKNRQRLSTGDYFHPNSIDVLTEEMAPAFPDFAPGDILVSIRELSMLVVIDSHGHKAKWARRGPWKYQHYARFQPDGTIMLYDNYGAHEEMEKAKWEKSPVSRLFKISPAGWIVWRYGEAEGEHFYSWIRGTYQPLSNGNLLINQSVGGRLIEVTPARERVWEYHYPYATEATEMNPIASAWRYAKDELPFLEP